MKKFLTILLVISLVLSFVACAETGNGDNTGDSAADSSSVATPDDSSAEPSGTTADSVKVMTHAEYVAAEDQTPVVIEGYIQNKQVYSEEYKNTSLYLQDKDGAYFVYRLACTADEYAKLTIGSKVRVAGFRGSFNGEIEVIDVSAFEIIAGDTYIAPAFDATALLGTDDLIKHQNEFVSFKGMTVVASKDAEGKDAAFLYKWNGTGEDGDDLYFNVSINNATYTFTVETDLCNKDTDVYSAVKALKIGDKIDLEGFLYWYEGVNPHITAVKAAQ